jgi:hypothetical protein
VAHLSLQVCLPTQHSNIEDTEKLMYITETYGTRCRVLFELFLFGDHRITHRLDSAFSFRFLLHQFGQQPEILGRDSHDLEKKTGLISKSATLASQFGQDDTHDFPFFATHLILLDPVRTAEASDLFCKTFAVFWWHRDSNLHLRLLDG